MPHISIKMLEGRSEEQKKRAVKAITETLKRELGVPEKYVSVTCEDYTTREWFDVYKQEITDKKDKLYKSPDYKPEELL